MRPSDREYYLSRRADSLKMALEATDSCAARIHRDLAEQYDHLLEEYGGDRSAGIFRLVG